MWVTIPRFRTGGFRLRRQITPRLPGGAVNPDAITVNGSEISETLIAKEETWNYLDDGSDQGTAWRNPGFNDASWSSGVAELGYGDGPTGAEGTEVGFGGDLTQKYITTYFRKEFTATDVLEITGLQLGLRRDDGAVVFLNGTEVWRSGMHPTNPIDYTTLATNGSGGTDETTFHQKNDISPSLLVEGTNTIAVEVHQNLETSSDISFDLELYATTPSDPSQLQIDESTHIQARVLNAGQWSPVNSLRFLVGDAANSTNLVVSEFSYRPARPSATEDPGGLYSRTDFEFIEFKNISTGPIHLDGVRLTDGVEFDFSQATNFSIAAGETLLIVENQAAFLARYPGVSPDKIAGEYDANLSNDGERIEILAADDSVLHAFTYNDQLPWPTAADGGGFSLELINPDSNPNHDDGTNWRASHGIHGTPAGEISPMDFATWQSWNFDAAELADPNISGPNADPNNNGWGNYAEFAFGQSPWEQNNIDSLVRSSFTTVGNDDFLTIEFDAWEGATGVTFAMQTSGNLTNWASDFTEILPAIDHGEGTTTHKFRSNNPIGSLDQEFVRLLFSN